MEGSLITISRGWYATWDQRVRYRQEKTGDTQTEQDGAHLGHSAVVYLQIVSEKEKEKPT